MGYLLYKVTGHSVDLLNHRLREDLDFATNFDRRDRPSGDGVALVIDRRLVRNQLAESSIAAACFDSLSPILRVQHPAMLIDSGL